MYLDHDKRSYGVHVRRLNPLYMLSSIFIAEWNIFTNDRSSYSLVHVSHSHYNQHYIQRELFGS